jgi:four helix bundle protein
MEQEKTVKYKSKRFAVRIVKLYKYLCEEKKEYVLSKQILRSGTSIGANLAESECAISEKDFLSKVYIALKECAETIYWLDLLFETDYLTKNEYDSILSDCEEMRKMLSATTKTMNSKLHSSHSKLPKGGTSEGEV